MADYVTAGPSTFIKDPNSGILVLTGTKKKVTPASTLNTQQKLEETQRNISAYARPIPLVYGEAQVGGEIFALNYTSGTWTIGYIIGLGELDSYTGVLINGEAPKSGVLVNYYLGTNSQTADPLLSAAIENYEDDLIITASDGTKIGVGYIVVQYTDTHYTDWPQVIATVKGKKVWNPDSQTVEFSENPVLHLADLLTNTHYGHGYSSDQTSLLAVYNYNDDGSIGEKRRESYLVIKDAKPVADWVSIAQTYAGCFLSIRGDTVYYVLDAVASPVMNITMDDIVANSLSIRKKDSSNLPTVIRSSYTDTSTTVWKEKLCDPAKLSGVDNGSTQWRESEISLVGIKRHSQAYRESVERINKLILSDLEVSWVMFDEAMQLEIGDVVTISHGFGLDNKKLRIVEDPQQISPGRWKLEGIEYSDEAYSDEIIETPSTPDTNLPTAGAPGLPTNIAVVEHSYQTQNGEYATRLNITWSRPTTGTVTGYTVEIFEGTDLVWATNVANPRATTSPLKESVLYTIKISAFNPLYSGEQESYNYTIIGKLAVPNPPTDLTGFEAGGEVRAWWVAPSAPSDFDVKRYEVRYYNQAETWDQGTVIDEVDALRIVTKDIPAGEWTLGVKSIDSIRQKSVGTAEINITVTLDRDAFRAGNLEPLDDYSSLVFVYEDVIASQGRTDFYSDGNDTWSSLFGSSAMNTFTDPLASYQSAQGISYWYSEELDLLQDQSGTWRAEIDVTDYSTGTVIEFGLKPDGGSYSWSTNLSRQAKARYAQIRVYSPNLFYLGTPQGHIYADVIAREESGLAQSNSSTYTRITLTNEYAAVRSIVLTPQGSAPYTAVFDNLIYGGTSSFDVYIFDNNGDQVSVDFAWQFKGV